MLELQIHNYYLNPGGATVWKEISLQIPDKCGNDNPIQLSQKEDCNTGK